MRPATLPPFQWVFDEHASSVHRFLVGLVGAVEADDCFQETMLSALRAYSRLGDASNLRGWLMTIARRKVIDAHRAAGRRPVPVADPEVFDAAHRDPSESGELWAEVAALPKGQRVAVEMRFGDDRSYRDIAERLEISEDAARQRVHQGLERLRRRDR